MAVPTYVEESDSGSLGTQTTLTHTIPSGWSADDLAIAFVTFAVNRSVSTPASGWTVIGSQQTGSYRCIAYYKILASGDINAAHSWVLTSSSASNNQIVFIRITGHDATTPINTSANAVDGSNRTTHVSPAVTTTVDDCLIVRLMASANFLTASSGDTGTQELQNANQRIFRSSLATAGSTGTATYTTGVSTNLGYCTIAVAPTSGGGSAKPTYYHHQQQVVA
jgi:hypothetical protein